MRGAVATAVVVAWGGVSPVAAVDVPLPGHPVTIDGDLHEWGKAAWIAVEPAGEGVGLRGVFQDDDDHDVVVLVQWDAEFLYVAAAVTDDILDVGRVAPDQREWKGSGSQRKDRMFYYDHMKVFVREPGVSAGYNLWFAPPGPEDEGPYWWGGRQRQPETVSPPQVQVAALVAGNTRTFEVAIPWTWMEAYPQSGDVFDAMFLFIDADRPGEEMAIKIARKEDRWIWWQGTLRLMGQPDGLRPRPEPEPRRRAEPVPVVQQPLDPRIVEAIARSRETAAARAAQLDSAATVARASPSVAPGATASRSAVAIAATAPPAPVDGEAISSRSATGSLRARLSRQLLARRTGASAPQYMRDLERDPSLSDAQIDTFYAVLRRHVSRIVTQRITSRIDFFVVDMASASRCRRDQSRKYLVDLLANLSGTHDDVAADWIIRAATRSGAGSTAAAAFVREVALRAGKIFAQRGITTSEKLIKRGRKKSGLDKDEAYALIGALLGL